MAHYDDQRKNTEFNKFAKWFLAEFGDTVEHRESLALFNVGAYRSDKITYTWLGWRAGRIAK